MLPEMYHRYQKRPYKKRTLYTLHHFNHCPPKKSFTKHNQSAQSYNGSPSQLCPKNLYPLREKREQPRFSSNLEIEKLATSASS